MATSIYGLGLFSNKKTQFFFDKIPMVVFGTKSFICEFYTFIVGFAFQIPLIFIHKLSKFNTNDTWAFSIHQQHRPSPFVCFFLTFFFLFSLHPTAESFFLSKWITTIYFFTQFDINIIWNDFFFNFLLSIDSPLEWQTVYE